MKTNLSKNDIKDMSQLYIVSLKKAIKKIVEKYDVNLLSCVANIQGTVDVELDRNIYYKKQEKMETEIFNLGNINDIYYCDVI